MTKNEDIRIASLGNANAVATNGGARTGTPGYRAPEITSGREVGPEADVFSVGVTLFEIATGILPDSLKFDRDQFFKIFYVLQNIKLFCAAADE